MNLLKLLHSIAIVAAFVLLPQTAHAATMSKEDANAYYHQCTATPDSRITQQTKEEFCACTSAHIMEVMTPADMKMMRENSAAGRVMIDRMMIGVNGPCMAGPITGVFAAQCENDPRVALADQTIDRIAVCACMTDKINIWMEENGPDIMSQVVSEIPYFTDPIGPLMQSAVYKKEEYEIMMDCMSNTNSILKKYR